MHYLGFVEAFLVECLVDYSYIEVLFGSGFPIASSSFR